MTTRFEGDENGQVKALHCVRVDPKMQPIPGSEFKIPERATVKFKMGKVMRHRVGKLSATLKRK